MKKVFGLFALILLLLAAGLTVRAQEEETSAAQKNPPRWVSAKGYWMVESNVHQRRHSCVYFYTNEGVLLHKETIDGKKLVVKRNRTKVKLKTALELLADAYAAGQSMNIPEETIAALFKK